MTHARFRTLRKSILCIGLVYFTGCVVNFKSEKETPQKGVMDVKVDMAYPGKSELNTFDGFYKKEIEKGRYAQTEIKLEPGQQLLVLNKALVLKFFQMPAQFTHKGAEATAEPHSLRIKADTLDRTVAWTGSMDDLHPNNFRLQELVTYIDSIVRTTDDYTGLPKSTIVGN
jgi:hypothetical protein